jgi:hypothetical protein
MQRLQQQQQLGLQQQQCSFATEATTVAQPEIAAVATAHDMPFVYISWVHCSYGDLGALSVFFFSGT